MRYYLTLLLTVVLLAQAGCTAGIDRLEPYHPITLRLSGENLPVVLRVTSDQTVFEFDPRIDMNDVVRYVRNGLAAELTVAGYVLTTAPEDRGVTIDVAISQVDLGYDLFFWWLGYGYSSSETTATVKLKVHLTDESTGRRYRRNFVGYQTTCARKIWLYFIPIPIQIMDDEGEMLHTVSQRVFSDLVRSVDELIAGQRSAGASR